MTNIFKKIEKFYLNKKNISIINKNVFNNSLDKTNIRKSKKKVEKKQNNNLNIKEKDKLFWYLYIFEHGIANYELLGRNKYSKEMALKVEFIEKLKHEKRLLKDNKLKFNDIQEKLLYGSLDIYTFFSITMIKKINLVYFTDHIIFINNKYEKDSIIIYYDKANKIFEIKDKINIEELKKDRLEIAYLKKPIKTLSNYKVNEIYEICKKLKIEIMKNSTKKFTKKELYEKIVQKIS